MPIQYMQLRLASSPFFSGSAFGPDSTDSPNGACRLSGSRTSAQASQARSYKVSTGKPTRRKRPNQENQPMNTAITIPKMNPSVPRRSSNAPTLICPVADKALHVELCMSTHLAIVVNLRVDFEQNAEYVGLVIPRSLCFGDKPTRHALVAAANDFLARWDSSQSEKKPAPRQVMARINGQWTSVLAASDPGRRRA